MALAKGETYFKNVLAGDAAQVVAAELDHRGAMNTEKTDPNGGPGGWRRLASAPVALLCVHRVAVVQLGVPSDPELRS